MLVKKLEYNKNISKVFVYFKYFKYYKLDMVLKKKIFPRLKKKINSFLTDESWKISKKNALGIVLWAIILNDVDWHYSSRADRVYYWTAHHASNSCIWHWSTAWHVNWYLSSGTNIGGAKWNWWHCSSITNSTYSKAATSSWHWSGTKVGWHLNAGHGSWCVHVSHGSHGSY